MWHLKSHYALWSYRFGDWVHVIENVSALEIHKAQFEQSQSRREPWLQDIFLRYTIHNSYLLSYERNQSELTRLKTQMI